MPARARTYVLLGLPPVAVDVLVLPVDGRWRRGDFRIGALRPRPLGLVSVVFLLFAGALDLVRLRA